MDNPVTVAMIIDPINQTHLGQMRGSVSVAGVTVELSGSRNLLWGGCWFGSLCSFFWAARRSHLRFKISSLCCLYHARFRSLANSGFLLGILNTTDFCLGRLSISIVLSANHSPRSRVGAGGGNLVPMGGTTPDLPAVDQTPHLSPFHQSQLVGHHVVFSL